MSSVRRTGEQGYLLLELATALPLIGMLLVGLGLAVVLCVRSYMLLNGDEELQQEVAICMQRMVNDALWGNSIATDQKQLATIKINQTGNTLGYGYDVPADYHDVQRYSVNGSKLVDGAAYAPMTGDNALGRVIVVEFRCDAVEGKPGLYRLSLTCRSMVTRRTYTLTTAVYEPVARTFQEEATRDADLP